MTRASMPLFHSACIRGTPDSTPLSGFLFANGASNRLSPFAFAYDVKTHFAYNMEYFLLDPTYACRQPLMFQYLSQQLGGEGQPYDPYHAIDRGICRVNTKVRVPQRFETSSGGKQAYFEIYDLNPENIDAVEYFRAGAGDEDVSSMFGHSMFRIVAKKGGAMSNGCPKEEDGEKCDVVVSHRANPLEMRLDSGKGMFGGYPAQLLLKDVYDILQDYGDDELRHIFNIPLGQTENGKFTAMSAEQKQKFIWATLEEHWAYVGNYKYITNNCANEAMRLYQMSSDDLHVGYVNDLVLPRSVDQKVLGPLGLSDESVVKGIKEPGLFGQVARKVFGKSQKTYLKQRRIIEKDKFVEVSKKYDLYDALADILRREDAVTKATVDCKDERNSDKCHTDRYDNVNRLDKEFKNWVQLAAVSKDSKQVCKNIAEYSNKEKQENHVAQILKNVEGRFHNLYDRAKKRYDKTHDKAAWEDMYQINREFYFALYLVERKRQHDLNDLMVKLAYDLARPDKGKEMICKGTKAPTAERLKVINGQLESYELLQTELQPFSKISLMYKTYGIPLESEMAPTDFMSALAQNEADNMDQFMIALRPELGMDYKLYVDIRGLRKDLCEQRVTDSLFKEAPPKCACLFPDQYSPEQVTAAKCSKDD